MRILQVCQRYYPYIGGLETHVRQISERLSRKGFEVEVLTTDPSGRLPSDEMVNGLRIMRFKSWAPNEAYYCSREFKRCLAKIASDYDVVHSHGYSAFPALYAAQTKGKNKLIFTPHYHGRGHTFLRNILHVPYRLIAKNLFKRADRVICVSNHEKSLIVRNFKVNEEKISLIPNGLNLADFKDLEKEKKDHRVILCVARLEKYKGIDLLIKVLSRLEDDVCLEIVGKGPCEKSLMKLTSHLQATNRVTFLKDLPTRELLQRYANADLFALLSRYEAYGISVAEALACKTPCIVANTSALQEWVDNKNCFGIMYPINLDKLARLINRVIGIEIECPKLSDWDENVEKLAELYEAYESRS